MHLFKGQGVKHLTEGYGVISKIIIEIVYDSRGNFMAEYPSKFVEVQFLNKRSRVQKFELVPADMPLAEREAMEKRVANLPSMRGSRILVLIQDARIFSFETAQVPEATTLENVRKCFHGNIIPTSYGDHSPSPWCSLCHPYSILVRDGATFKA